MPTRCAGPGGGTNERQRPDGEGERSATASRRVDAASARARAATRAAVPAGGETRPPYEAVLGQMVTIREDGGDGGSPPPRPSCCMTKRGLEGDGAAARAAMAAIERSGQPGRRATGPARSSLSVSASGQRQHALEPLRMARKLDRYRETARMALGALDRRSGPRPARQSAAHSGGAGDGRPGHADAEEGALAGLVDGEVLADRPAPPVMLWPIAMSG